MSNYNHNGYLASSNYASWPTAPPSTFGSHPAAPLTETLPAHNASSTPPARYEPPIQHHWSDKLFDGLGKLLGPAHYAEANLGPASATLHKDHLAYKREKAEKKAAKEEAKQFG